jgi:hypothetical protein
MVRCFVDWFPNFIIIVFDITINLKMFLAESLSSASLIFLSNMINKVDDLVANSNIFFVLSAMMISGKILIESIY